MVDPVEDVLSHLGKQSPIETNPEDVVLDRINNKHHLLNYVARFTIPEMTSLCPVTGQPDFATLVVDYIPNKWLVESKSLKLYVYAFRNVGSFHEDCTMTIGRRLAEVLEPDWLRIAGFWNARGGISIDVFWQTGLPPIGASIPDLMTVGPYLGRR